jgi:multidrug resistance efflux pump
MQCVTVPDGGEVCPGLGTREEQARAAWEAAEEAYTAAEARLNQLKRGATKEELAAAQGRVDAAKAQQSMAQAQLAQVEKGARTEQLSAAEAQVAVTQAQIEAAAAQIASAQAQIDVLDVQIDKLTLKAPMSGVVLNRSIEPGEIVAPGAKLLIVADTANLYMTVYEPENRSGEIALGQVAQVTADSFPGEVFNAKVTRIADQAEFTPRNVQTAEGRATTVFAVKLTLENAGGKLKPGMPADVRFEK